MTRGFTRILVPTDFSAPSQLSLTAAKELAERLGASIHLLHVLEDPYATAAYATEVYGYLPPDIKETWRHDAEAHMDTVLTPEERIRFRATAEVLFGSPARTIVEHADAAGYDLIVMGTHGRGGVAHLFLGSVAERVVRTAHCPVLTVRGTNVAREAVPVAAMAKA